jgi:hypothetical protein
LLDTVKAVHFEAAELPWDEIRYESTPGEVRSDHELFYYRLMAWVSPAAQELHDLTDNVRRGKWSCLMMMKDTVWTFILVVRWMQDIDDVTAERVRGLVLVTSRDEELPVVTTQWRRVRLV